MLARWHRFSLRKLMNRNEKPVLRVPWYSKTNNSKYCSTHSNIKYYMLWAGFSSCTKNPIRNSCRRQRIAAQLWTGFKFLQRCCNKLIVMLHVLIFRATMLPFKIIPCNITFTLRLSSNLESQVNQGAAKLLFNWCWTGASLKCLHASTLCIKLGLQIIALYFTKDTSTPNET